MQLRIVLAGNQRLAENVILEVRALAQRYGLDVPKVTIESQPTVGAKSKILAPRRGASSRARRKSSPRSRT